MEEDHVFEYDANGNITRQLSTFVSPEGHGLYTAGMINGPGNPRRQAFDGAGRPWLRERELHMDGQGDLPLDLSNPAIPGGVTSRCSSTTPSTA